MAPKAVASEPSTRRGGVVGALLKKNWIVKKRHPFATLAELLCPLLCILLFTFLKSLDPDLDIPAGWATTNGNRTASGSNSTGSHWIFFSQVELLSELVSSVAGGAGLGALPDESTDAGAGSASASPTPSPSKTLTASDPLLMSSGISPLSTASMLGRLQVPRFFFQETTMAGLLLNLAIQSLAEAHRLGELSEDDQITCLSKFALLGLTSLDPESPHAMPAECRGKVVPYKIAIAPDTAYTRQYLAAILHAWHPRLPLMEPIGGTAALYAPAFADSRMLFANESALEAYVTSDAYGLDVDHPKIYAAVTFQEFPQNASAIGDARGHDLAFTIRMNSSSSNPGIPNSVPRTSVRRFQTNKYVRSVKAQNTMSYATRGFLTLQTAVMRVANCLPPWDAERERVVDAGVCQLTQSTMNATSADVDARLLMQMEDDLIVRTLFRLTSEIFKGTTGPESFARYGNKSLALYFASKLLSARTLNSAGIPAESKRALLRVFRQAPQPYLGGSVFVSPTDAFHYGRFYEKVSVAFPILFLLSYLYGVSRVIVALLMEKETRSREFMKILGIHDGQIVATWLATYLQIFAVASLLQAVGASFVLFRHSTTGLLVAFFFSFALSTFGFGFLVSAFFDRARTGSFAGMGLFFMTFFVSYVFREGTSETSRTLGCLLSPVALSQGINLLAKLEAIGVGITLDNAGADFDGFRFTSAVGMQLLDFFLYMAVGSYVEKVMPKEHGVAQPWYFPLLWVYNWRPRRDLNVRDRPPPAPANGDQAAAEQLSVTVIEESSPDVPVVKEEPVPAEMKKQERDGRAIVISQLRKVFDVPGGTKVAVRGLSLSLYEGQILCLLGHNGAGKTTLMSMLTGMTPPTSGDAFIRGVSILDGIHVIRQSLGYCPQYSVVYPELTVEEHLRFYAQAKQRDSDAAADIASMLREVGLTEKRRVQAHALSGGMKRKLSLAIAFLGNNRVVFLDEPTSGMDPYSRRSTWELIQRHKAGRIVILTTHFMDEADLLGDRIAILAEGELRCVGSSLFLKQQYGVGYRLSFVVKTASHGREAETDTATQRLVALIETSIADAKLATDVGTELTFQLPFQSSAQFPVLFDAIDARKTELGIESYAISVTTLEEIFLKVAESSRAASEVSLVEATQPRGHKLAPVLATATADALRKPRGCVASFLLQLYALLLKRLLSATRDRSMLFYSTLLPATILLATLSALSRSQLIADDPSIALTMADQYELGTSTPLPVACVEGGGASDPWASPWCESALALIADAAPSRVHVEPTVYSGNGAAVVFNLSYVNQPIDPRDSTGYSLRFAELAFERGYAKDAATLAPLANRAPVVGQYGGLLFQATPRDRVLAYNILVNSSALHGAPTYKALADQAIHNLLLANGSASASAPSRRIRVSTHPFPLPVRTRSIYNAAISLQAAIFVLIAFTFLPAAMMPFLVKEKQRESNARHQQLLSGVSLLAYWLANLLFDLLLYLVPMAVAVVLLQYYGITSSLGGSHASAATCSGCTRDVVQAVVALFALFGAAVVPWTYATSHLMRDAGSCLLYTVMLNVVFGLVLQLTSFALDLLEASRAANLTLVFLWRCSPLFSLSNGLMRVAVADIEALYGLRSEPVSAFSKDVAGYEITYLAVQGPLFFLVTLLVDMHKTGELSMCGLDVRSWLERCKLKLRLPKPRVKTQVRAPTSGVVKTRKQTLLLDDADVRAERCRVLTEAKQGTSNDVVRITELSKTYPNGKRALTSLTFGLQRGDCFGFLGINGAGKTTTMQILTGDLLPTHGTATLSGYDILKDSARVRQSIGYCPQFDGLLDLLTVREHLELFGRLKGFSGRQLETQVQRLIHQFQLNAFERKLAISLSGGNKRKLSVAIAMLGEPELLFLDEPSTGMDPFSRRFLWDIILRVSVQSRKSTVMLTTHSMEECEALCNRAGIMVGGELQCFGTIPHLKNRFGDGFLLECKLEIASEGAVGVVVEKLTATGLVHCTEEGVQIESCKLAAACEALATPERLKWVLECGSAIHGNHATGSGFYEQLQRSASSLDDAESLDAHEFVAWWLLEDRVAALALFLETHFGSHGNVVMVERQLDFCRFKLTPAAVTAVAETVDRPFALGRTFRLMEDARATLFVKEYAIAQTSLEQIFNRFAQKQQPADSAGGVGLGTK